MTRKISRKGIHADDTAKQNVLDFIRPSTVKEMQRFLGVVNWLHDFIPNAADILYPLTELKRLANAKKPLHWTKESLDAFQKIKEVIKKAPILKHPEFDKPFVIFCDASNYAIGGVLCQMNEKNKLQPIQYVSKKLTGNTLNWHIAEKETYACVYCLEKWEKYLLPHHNILYTDAKNLESLFNKNRDHTNRLFRWGIRVSPFSFTAKYLPGPQNSLADYLSRDYPHLLKDIEYLKQRC